MKILITGATGLIGSELIKKLLENKHTVHFLTTSKNKIINNSNLKGFYWNIEQKEIDSKCMDGVEVIIHLAGASISKRWTNQYKNEILSSRIDSMDLIFKYLKENTNQVKHFISASGTAIYPESFSTVYDETSTEMEDSYLSRVVQKWEEKAKSFEELGIKVAMLRTGIVLSNKGGALPEMVKPIKLGFGAIMGTGKQIQSWIHINDLVNLYTFILENNFQGVYNAIAPNIISNKEMTKDIAQALNKPLWLLAIPQFFMKFILGEMSYLLFSSKCISSSKVLHLGFQFEFATFKKAFMQLYA